MGFSASPKAIERVRVMLDVVADVKDESSSISFPSATPNKLAYALFEALKVATKLPIEHPDYKYAKLKQKYQIKVKEKAVSFAPRLMFFGAPIIELSQSRIVENNLTLSNLSAVLEIIGACIKHKCTITFPDASLSAESFAQLKKWADKNNYSFEETIPLIMTKNDASLTEEISTT